MTSAATEYNILEVFLSYCTSGIDFELPGNGGPDCAAFLSNPRRIYESLIAMAICSLSLLLGWKLHTPPPSELGFDSPNPYVYTPTRIFLLLAMTFTYAMELCYKFATSQAVFIVNPCHMLCVIHILLLALPAKTAFTTYLFRFHLFFIHGPVMAVIFPVTNTLFLPFEVTTYWVEHALLLIIPFYLLRQGGYFTVEPFKDLAWVFMSYGIWGLYHWGFLDPLAIFTLGNVNSMLCPAISDPFYGSDWRMYALGHQFLLNLLSGKILAGTCGIAEVRIAKSKSENRSSKVSHEQAGNQLLDNKMENED